MNGYDPAGEGWHALPGAALPCGPGVPWSKRIGDEWRYGLLTGDTHANVNGVVHGGVRMAFADQGLSLLTREAAERAPCTTIQLNTHFLDRIKPGEFLELRGEVIQRTTGLAFLRGVIAARTVHGVRDAGVADGVWRVLRHR
jgi:acyl-coenzyme A thioesterase PaaI-like protein